MALDSPARWGFACKFSVLHPCSARRQKIFPNWEISLDLLQYYFPGWLSRCQKIFHTICQKALRHLLANSAFRSFGEVTQNFRANRRRPVKPPKNEFFPQCVWMPSRQQKQVPEYGVKPDEPERPQVRIFNYLLEIPIHPIFSEKSMLNRKVWGPPYQTCLWPRASLGESGWVAKEHFFLEINPIFFQATMALR